MKDSGQLLRSSAESEATKKCSHKLQNIFVKLNIVVNAGLCKIGPVQGSEMDNLFVIHITIINASKIQRLLYVFQYYIDKFK